MSWNLSLITSSTYGRYKLCLCLKDCRPRSSSQVANARCVSFSYHGTRASFYALQLAYLDSTRLYVCIYICLFICALLRGRSICRCQNTTCVLLTQYVYFAGGPLSPKCLILKVMPLWRVIPRRPIAQQRLAAPGPALRPERCSPVVHLRRVCNHLEARLPFNCVPNPSSSECCIVDCRN